jgi:hypothetical protein
MKRAKKSKVDMLGGVLLDILEAEQYKFDEELSSITGIEFLLAAGIMNPDMDLCDLVEFARSNDQPFRMVFCQLLANGNQESDFLLTEVKNKFKIECPELYDYLEDVYGNEFECLSSVESEFCLDDE